MSNPSLTALKTIGILGAGTMGAGIAQLAAQAGYPVWLYDIQDAFLERGCQGIFAFLQKGIEKGKTDPAVLEQVKARLSTTTQLADLADCDLVIEAVPEDMELKKRLFSELDGLLKPEAILASNTSSLSITAIGGATQRPEQVAGLHFFNPVPLMALVEVIQGQRTADATLDTLTAFAESLGKTAVRAKDTPGFIVNRVARPFYSEALKILGEQGGTPEAIQLLDTVMKEAGGFRMGPFELVDLIGIDVNFAVTQSVYHATFEEARFRPHPIQAKMVAAGLLGRKTGQGFYPYGAG